MHLVAGYCRCKPVLCVPAKGGFGEGLFRSAHIQFYDLAVIHAVTLLFPFLSRPFTPIHRKQTLFITSFRRYLKNIVPFCQKYRRRFVKRRHRSSALQRQMNFSVRFAAFSLGSEISALNCSAFRVNYIKCGFVCQRFTCRRRCCFRHFYASP